MTDTVDNVAREEIRSHVKECKIQYERLKDQMTSQGTTIDRVEAQGRERGKIMFEQIDALKQQGRNMLFMLLLSLVSVVALLGLELARR